MEADAGAESITLNDVTINMPTGPEPHGYDRLASFMGFFPEAAIFSRFAALNAKNLCISKPSSLFSSRSSKGLRRLMLSLQAKLGVVIRENGSR
jgi:hypothetical protein